MPKFHDAKGAVHEVKIEPTIYSEAHKANLSVEAYINRKYPTDMTKYGSAYNQILSSEGLIVPSPKLQRELGMRVPTMADVLSGQAMMDLAGTTAGVGSTSGSQSRTLFPTALVSWMENALVKDYETDANVFDKLIGLTQSVASDKFEQPIVNMSGTKNGPMTARAQRRAQLTAPAAMMTFTTTDKIRRIPTFALGMEFSKESLAATTLDMVGMSVKRQMMVERDAWVYSYLSDMIAGDNDINSGSIAAGGYTVATATLDTACPATKISQKAWLKWLARNRKYRKIDWVMCDLDTYLLIEGRTGRPSLTAIDTLLPRLESQAVIQNVALGDVKVFIVDDASAGGPIPANTIVGIDSRYAIARVRNTSADVTAAETYALRQAEAFSMQFGEICYRLQDQAWDTLTVSQ